MENTEITERIKKVIEYSKLSTYSFASHIGISQSTLYTCARGRVPSVELLQRILTTYPEISASWLLMGEGEMTDKDDTRNQTIDILKEQLKEKDEQIRMLIGKIK